MAVRPKSMKRWIVRTLVVGLVLLGIVAEKSASDRDAALAMPISNNPGDQGSFTELRGDWFSVPNTAKHEYEPSQVTRELSTKHMDLDGALPRFWYEFVPETNGKCHSSSCFMALVETGCRKLKCGKMSRFVKALRFLRRTLWGRPGRWTIRRHSSSFS